MSLVDHLHASRTPLELAKLLAATAKENALLRDRVGALEHELFWTKVDMKNSDTQDNNEAASAPDLHSAIMNLRCEAPADYDPRAKCIYKSGHRDARHAAAELVSAAAAEATSAPVPRMGGNTSEKLGGITGGLRDQALAMLGSDLAHVARQRQESTYSYASTQETNCASCGENKHTPLRIDAMGGYVCLTCIDKRLGSLLGEFGYPAPTPSAAVAEGVDTAEPAPPKVAARFYMTEATEENPWCKESFSVDEEHRQKVESVRGFHTPALEFVTVEQARTYGAQQREAGRLAGKAESDKWYGICMNTAGVDALYARIAELEAAAAPPAKAGGMSDTERLIEALRRIRDGRVSVAVGDRLTDTEMASIAQEALILAGAEGAISHSARAILAQQAKGEKK